MNDKNKRLCKKLIYKEPIFINELMEELGLHRTVVLTIMRQVKTGDANVKIANLFNDRIIFVNTPDNKEKVYYKLRKKYNEKFKVRGVPWRDLRMIIKGKSEYIDGKHYKIVDDKKIPVDGEIGVESDV